MWLQPDALPHRYQDRIILSKPYLFNDIIRALVAAMNPANHARDGQQLNTAATIEDTD